MSIAKQIELLRRELPEGVSLIAVSKYHSQAEIMEAYGAGQRDFGENKVQELVEKQAALPKDIRWHMLGHLQRNKVKMLLPSVAMIHSVDSLRLLNEIQKHAEAAGKVVDCLLEIKVAKEETKSGFLPEECSQLLQSGVVSQLPNVKICGLMGMATQTDDAGQIEKEFKFIYNFFHHLRQTQFAQCTYFKELSMGMTGDYPLAVSCGSTMVRIGTKIFGERSYPCKPTEA